MLLSQEDEDLQADEELLNDYDKGRQTEQEFGPPILKSLAERICRYWIEESGRESTFKSKKYSYKPPENIQGPTIQKVNKLVKDAVHPAVLRQDSRLCKLQDGLISATCAVAKMANTALESEKKGEMINAKDLITDALNVVTILGHLNKDLSLKRRENLCSGLNKETAAVCKAQPKNEENIFGDGLKKALEEKREAKKLAWDSSFPPRQHKQQFHGQRGSFRGRYQNYSDAGTSSSYARGRGSFLQRGKKPQFRNKKN